MNSTERHEARYQRRKAARIEKKAKALKEFGDFGAVFSFDHLYASYRASIKGVGWKASTQRYKSSALAHIAKTQEELLTGKYRSRGFYEFDLVERGKPRHIRSVHISERVVQRCLCDYCLVPALSKSFIYDNGASLPGKGYDFAVSRVTRFLADHYRRYGNEGYALIFDFSKYFDTAHHEPIFEQFRRSGIGGYFNLRHGTKVTENGGFLHAPDGRGICAVTSEDGWEHFRPDTLEGAYRQKLLDKLYRFYISGKGDAAADFTAERFPDADNYYWKNLLRTMPTPKLTAFYSARLGQPPKMEG